MIMERCSIVEKLEKRIDHSIKRGNGNEAHAGRKSARESHLGCMRVSRITLITDNCQSNRPNDFQMQMYFASRINVTIILERP